MVIPEAPPPKLRIDLAATGWAACFTVWFIAFIAIALFGDGNPMAYAALFGLFTAGRHAGRIGAGCIAPCGPPDATDVT